MDSITIKQSQKEKRSRVFILLFFGIFAVAGSVMLYLMTVRPLLRVAAASDWEQVPCRIISAGVKTHDGGSESDTYSIKVLYSYNYDGREYRGDDYDFLSGSSSGYERKAKVVKGYLNSNAPVCYVNPNEPSRSVLRKGLHWGYLIGLFPIPFAAVGFGGIIYTLKNRSKTRVTTSSWAAKQKGASFESQGQHVMKSGSPWTKLVGIIIFVAIWDGMVGFFVFNQLKGGLNLFSGIFLIFLIPFILIGLAILILPFTVFLTVFNPRVTLSLSNASVPLGGSIRLKWQLSGKANMIDCFRISLKGTEEAVDGSGSSSTTYRNIFYQKEIYSTRDCRTASAGDITLNVPKECMHSFEAKNNRIIWKIVIHGEIDRRPDLREEFKFTVAPLPEELL